MEKIEFSFFTIRALQTFKSCLKGRYVKPKLSFKFSVVLFPFPGVTVADPLKLQGCDTVLVTPTARTIDIAHAWVMVKFLSRIDHFFYHEEIPDLVPSIFLKGIRHLLS